jgi:hypothetical protein
LLIGALSIGEKLHCTSEKKQSSTGESLNPLF